MYIKERQHESSMKLITEATLFKDKATNMDDEMISTISKHFKEIVKESVKKKAFDDLIKLNKTHSKMDNLNYDQLKIQNYLKTDSKMTNDEKQLLFRMRTRMTDVKLNFKNKYVDHLCLLGQIEEESQSHLMECLILKDKCEALKENMEVEYKDIFKNNTKQQKAIKLLRDRPEIPQVLSVFPKEKQLQTPPPPPLVCLK